MRRGFIPKRPQGQRPLGIPTVKDPVVPRAWTLVLRAILEADFHPRSLGFRPRRHAQQALLAIRRALSRGRPEALEADGSKYFDPIPQRVLWRLKLNEEKTRLVDSRRGCNFPGLTVRWQTSRTHGRWSGHVEPSVQSQPHLRESVRRRLNHWTGGQSIPETASELNLFLRGGSGYFHFQHSRRGLGKLRWWVQTRRQRWWWRKHGCWRALWSDYPVATRYERHGLWPLPLTAGWTGPTPKLNAHDEASRKAGYGKPVRPV